MVAGKQNFKCANDFDAEIEELEEYECPRWKMTYNQGSFDEACYKIDHVVEYSFSQDNSVDNLCALCPNCYAVKKRREKINRIMDKNENNQQNTTKGLIERLILLELENRKLKIELLTINNELEKINNKKKYPKNK